MMRTLVALLAITAVSGQEVASQADCALDSTRAVDDIMDGLVYIFASIVRCDDGASGDQVRCIMDISSAIESVNKMANIIVQAVRKCGAITTEKPQCGIAIGELTRSLAGLTAASAGIVADCVQGVETPGAPHGGLSNTFGQCVVNVKDSVKSLFKAVKRAMVLSDHCTEPGSEECAHNAVKLVDAFVGLAEYISGAVGKCSANPKDNANGQCAQMSARITHAAGEVGVAGTALAVNCAPTDAERLYLDSLGNKKVAAAPASNSLTIALAAFLPLTAVVAFVGGKRMAKVHSFSEQVADEEMLVQSE